jgi:hypothetical protein
MTTNPLLFPVPALSAVPELHLYIGCIPCHGEHADTVRPLEDIISAYSESILTVHKVKDLRLVPYGQGAGYLAAALRASPPGGVFYCHSAHGTLTAAVLEALIPLATSVTQGLA